MAIASSLIIACGLFVVGGIVALVWSFFAPGKTDTGRIVAKDRQLICGKVCYTEYSITLQDGHSFTVDPSVYAALAVGDAVAVTYQGILTNGVRRVTSPGG